MRLAAITFLVALSLGTCGICPLPLPPPMDRSAAAAPLDGHERDLCVVRCPDGEKHYPCDMAPPECPRGETCRRYCCGAWLTYSCSGLRPRCHACD